MKLVHAADLHLDSPLRGLARYPGAPVERVRTATRRALENLVRLCTDERAGLLLLAGDLYDGDWTDYSTGQFFVSQMAKLRDAGVRVVSIRGNHDAQSQITRHLRLPDNVRELRADAAESVAYDDLGVVVHGQSFATRAVIEDLAASYPSRVSQLINVGLLHTSVTGRAGHQPYAPCSLETLVNKGYDYWALGHVHAREVLCERPWVVFPGNLQGRHARELGGPAGKGASVISYDAGGIRSVTHHALDVLRYAHCLVDLATATNMDDALQCARDALDRQLQAADGRPLAVRVTLTGVSAAHGVLRAAEDALVENLRALGTDIGGGQLWIEKVKVTTRPPLSAAALRSGDGAIAQLLHSIDELREDDAALLALVQSLGDLPRLPAELTEDVDGVALTDPGFLRSQIEAVEQMLLERLLGGERGS